MSDHRIPQQAAIIPAAADHGAVAAGRGRGSRRGRARGALIVALAALSSASLVAVGFLAGAAAGNSAGDEGREVGFAQAMFGSADLSSSGSFGSPAPANTPSPAPSPGATPPADDAGATDRAASGAPDPNTAQGSSDGRSSYSVRGDVVDIDGEQVLVCATGDGLGISHIGATLAPGADGEATRTESDRLCGDAFRVTGALIMDGRGGDALATPRDVNAGGRAYQCAPAGEKVLRCAAEDRSIVTLWSVAP